MTEPTLTLACSGRAVDDFGHALGDPCGKVYPRPFGSGRYCCRDDFMCVEWIDAQPVDDDAYLTSARAAGWSVGPNREACCPKCRKPSAGVLRDVAAIERSLR